MIYFFRRGAESISCETRINADGDGYELVITEHGKQRTEPFATVADMLAREHELLQAWRAQGWVEAGFSPKKPGAARR